MPDTVDRILWATDDGWRYRLKHVKQMKDINILYIVASHWIITYPSIHWTGLGWPQDRSGRVGEDRNLLPLHGLSSSSSNNNNTYSMVQSPSWEANWFAASHEIPRNSHNLKVHYRTHKRPPPVSILGPTNPVHIPTSHLLEIHPNVIHPFMPRSPSLRFPQQDPTHTPLLTHTHHMPSPSHSSRFYHCTILGEEYKSFSSSLCSLLHSPVPPRSKYSPQHHILKHPQLPFLLQCQWPSFTPIQNNRQNNYSSIYSDTLANEWPC